MAKTRNFGTYMAFLAREDKRLNGTNGPADDRDLGNEGCWNCTGCTACVNCSECTGCTGCVDCTLCRACSACTACTRYTGCRDLKADDKHACFRGLYRFVVSPRISADGTQRIQMGCATRTRREWETDEWHHPAEFPNDGSHESKRRNFALRVALMWLDENSK